MVTSIDPVNTSVPRAVREGRSRAQKSPSFAMFFMLLILAFLIWVLATA